MTDINRLTDEQRKLVEDNEHLIYGFIHKYNLPVDEFYDLCAIGLCEAARKYNIKKGAFSTYAYMWMLSRVDGHRRKASHQVAPSLSLDQPVKDYDRIASTLGDLIADVTADTFDCLSTAVMPGFDTLSGREKQVALLLVAGLKYREIGQMLGVTHARIYQYKAAIRKKLSIALLKDY